MKEKDIDNSINTLYDNEYNIIRINIGIYIHVEEGIAEYLSVGK
ncbi:hypothetical protein [Clostridium pasteurianum]|nr:hypothetical protein [Clostridium pasteurianum]